MPQEKRNNLAIYTLVGSILLSSVLISMNPSNAHSTSATKKEFLALKKCISGFQKESAEFYETYSDIYDERPRQNPPSSYEPYLKEMERGYYGVAPESLLVWIAYGLEC